MELAENVKRAQYAQIHNAHLLGPEDRALEAESKVNVFYDKMRENEHLLLNFPVKIGFQGPGRSGKDAAAEWLVANTPLKFAGTTSTVISRQIAYEDNIDFEEAHAKRHKERDRWRAKGDWMRRYDPARLAKLVSVGSNIIAGIRADIEMMGVLNAGILDINYWIDRPGVDHDPTQGFGPELCHAVILNWWSLNEFYQRLEVIARSYGWLIPKR